MPSLHKVNEMLLVKGLRKLLADYGMHLLTDDGITIWRDDYTDTFRVHFTYKDHPGLQGCAEKAKDINVARVIDRDRWKGYGGLA